MAGGNLETDIIERIARMEQSLKNNEEITKSLVAKIDELIAEVHNIDNTALMRTHDLEVRLSNLETRINTEHEDKKTLYTKMGLLGTLAAIVVETIFHIIGR